MKSGCGVSVLNGVSESCRERDGRERGRRGAWSKDLGGEKTSGSASARACATAVARGASTTTGVGREGVEPSSLGVKARCSAD